MAPIIRVLMLALASALVTLDPVYAEQGSDYFARMWNCLREPNPYDPTCMKKRCDEAAARKETLAIMQWVVKEEQYNAARDVFRRNGCTEADLKRVIARDQQQQQRQPTSCAELLPYYARAIEAANPTADGATKGLALQEMMAMAGCGSRQQTTDCKPNFSGGFTCTTR